MSIIVFLSQKDCLEFLIENGAEILPLAVEGAFRLNIEPQDMTRLLPYLPRLQGLALTGDQIDQLLEKQTKLKEAKYQKILEEQKKYKEEQELRIYKYKKQLLEIKKRKTEIKEKRNQSLFKYQEGFIAREEYLRILDRVLNE